MMTMMMMTTRELTHLRVEVPPPHDYEVLDPSRDPDAASTVQPPEVSCAQESRPVGGREWCDGVLSIIHRSLGLTFWRLR